MFSENLAAISTKNDIKGCHWLKDNKRVIAKFAQEKGCRQLGHVKNGLTNLSFNGLRPHKNKTSLINV